MKDKQSEKGIFMGVLARIKFKLMYSLGKIQIVPVIHKQFLELGPGWEINLDQSDLARFPIVSSLTEVYAVTINGQDTKVRIWLKNNSYSNINFTALSLDFRNGPEINENDTPIPMFKIRDVVSFSLDKIGFYQKR